MPACYFDVDGTLVRTNLVHPTVYYLLNQPTPLHSLRKLGTAVLRGPAMALAEMRDRRTFNELLYLSYSGVSEDRLLEMAQDCFETVMRPNMFAGARALVRRCLDEGHDVVLVSGALDVLMAHMAEELGEGITWIANRLEMHGRKATGKILRPVVAGPTKARLIAEHAKSRGHDLGECFAFSDSYSDVPMLSVVGQPAAVNPDRKLAMLAKAYDWPVIDLSVKSASA